MYDKIALKLVWLTFQLHQVRFAKTSPTKTHDERRIHHMNRYNRILYFLLLEVILLWSYCFLLHSFDVT